MKLCNDNAGLDGCLFRWKGWAATGAALRDYGWRLKREINIYGNYQRIVMRDNTGLLVVAKIPGRALPEVIDVQQFMVERNARFKQKPQEIITQSLTERDIPVLLEAILELQQNRQKQILASGLLDSTSYDPPFLAVVSGG